MRIGFFDVESWEKDILKKAFPKDKLFFSKDHLNPKNVSNYLDLDIIGVFVHSKINLAIINKLPKLKMIAARSTGFDYIDLIECKKRGIVVSNVPEYGENTVAEYTFALILALSRKIILANNRTHLGTFRLSGLRGFDLQNKVLGVVGAGNIGKHVIRMAKAFEMQVLVYDVMKNEKLAKRLGFKYVSLNSLLKRSDIVTLHIPHNKNTHHLIGKKDFKLMKRSAYFINTSRGAVIDTKALITTLKKKMIAGAALDVLENEDKILAEIKYLKKTKKSLTKIIQSNPLLKMPNVIITPHNAFNTQEALTRIIEVTIDNINSFKQGKKKNTVK
tara:strand:- start:834 stop:1826 length:993 start_codon:yes stop_codon:yes gene_type:complete